MTGPYDDIAQTLAENPPGAFRRLVDSWPARASMDEVLDGLESAGVIPPLQRQLASYAVQFAQGSGSDHFAVELAMRLETLNLRVDLRDDPALEMASNIAWARR